MQITGILASIRDFSNFFDHQLFVHHSLRSSFYMVRNGAVKPIKLPPHIKQLIDDRTVLSRRFKSQGEINVLHLFRLGDGYTLIINDPGTGNVLNGFVMSLISVSSAVAESEGSRTDASDMNSVLLDKLVAEFDKEKMRFSVTDKRQKEEIIILEEQAKDAYRQVDEVTKQLEQKEDELTKLKKQFISCAEDMKFMEKRQTDLEFTSDYQLGAELKKKNEVLRENNRELVEALKKYPIAIEELRTEIDMYLNDVFSGMNIPDETKKEIVSGVAEIFGSRTAKPRK